MKKSLLGFLFFLIFTAFTFSQEDVSTYLDSSSLSYISDAPVYVIDREDIAASSARTLSDLLASNALFFIYNKGRIGEISLVGGAGTPQGYVAVLLNNVPYKLLTTGRAELPPIPVSAIDRIEIYKGPDLSGLYGQGAPAGAVNIVTKDRSEFFVSGKIGATGYLAGEGSEIYDNSGMPGLRDYKAYIEESLFDTVYLDGAIYPVDNLLAALVFISSANDFGRTYSPDELNAAFGGGFVDYATIYANDNNLTSRLSGSLAYSFSVGGTDVRSFSYSGLVDTAGPVSLVDLATFYEDSRWTLYTQWSFSSVRPNDASSLSVVARYDDQWIDSWFPLEDSKPLLTTYRLSSDYKRMWAFDWGRTWLVSDLVLEFSESHSIGEPVFMPLFKLGAGIVWEPLSWLELYYDASYSVSPAFYWTFLQSDYMTLLLPFDSTLKLTASPLAFADVFASFSHSYTPLPSLYGFAVPVNGDPVLYGGFVSGSNPSGLELFTVRGGLDFYIGFMDFSLWADYVSSNNMPGVSTDQYIDWKRYDIFYIESVLELYPYDFFSMEFMLHYAPVSHVDFSSILPDPYLLAPVWAVPVRASAGFDFYIMDSVLSFDVIYNGHPVLDFPYDSVVSLVTFPDYFYVEFGAHVVLPGDFYVDARVRNLLNEDYYVNPLLKAPPLSMELTGGVGF